jgi:hypothetical protein
MNRMTQNKEKEKIKDKVLEQITIQETAKQIFDDINDSIYDADGKLIELKSIINTLEFLKKKWCKE